MRLPCAVWFYPRLRCHTPTQIGVHPRRRAGFRGATGSQQRVEGGPTLATLVRPPPRSENLGGGVFVGRVAQNRRTTFNRVAAKRPTLAC